MAAARHLSSPGAAGRAETLRITEVAFGGRGIGRLPDGRVAFVPFVIEGELARVRILRERKSYVEAAIEQVEESSPHRVPAPCPYFSRCGGCSYQHIAGEEQLALKERQAAQVLRRIGRIDPVPLRAAVGSPLSYEYRNRITVHARDGRVGFFERDGHTLVEIDRCLLAEPAVNAALERLRSRPARPDGHYTLRAEGARGGFSQTNDGAAAELLALAASLATPGPGAHLVDAHCGAGFFARHLRDRFASVTGIEWDRHAIADARRQALAHETYVSGDVALHLPEALGQAAGADTWLITDPPAEGLPETVRRAILDRPPARWIYVSCNPATLARDLAAVRDAFDLLSVTPLDMFPQTAEIEVVAFLAAKP